jgi:hypothetical protein
MNFLAPTTSFKFLRLRSARDTTSLPRQTDLTGHYFVHNWRLLAFDRTSPVLHNKCVFAFCTTKRCIIRLIIFTTCARKLWRLSVARKCRKTVTQCRKTQMKCLKPGGVSQKSDGVSQKRPGRGVAKRMKCRVTAEVSVA